VYAGASEATGSSPPSAHRVPQAPPNNSVRLRVLSAGTDSRRCPQGVRRHPPAATSLGPSTWWSRAAASATWVNDIRGLQSGLQTMTERGKGNTAGARGSDARWGPRAPRPPKASGVEKYTPASAPSCLRDPRRRHPREHTALIAPVAARLRLPGLTECLPNRHDATLSQLKDIEAREAPALEVSPMVAALLSSPETSASPARSRRHPAPFSQSRIHDGRARA
jgi:hypothetical protein